MNDYRILVVDDEEDLCEILKFNLENEGYEVDTANSAEEALRMDIGSYSLLLLDVMMGEISGFKMASMLKKDKKTAQIPIIFITAKDTENDTVTGFNLGADDYISKPFSLREVAARVKAVLRRTRQGETEHAPEQIVYKTLVLDIIKKKVCIDGEEAPLTKKEFEILLLLLQNKGRVFSREDISEPHLERRSICAGPHHRREHHTSAQENRSLWQMYRNTLGIWLLFRSRITTDTFCPSAGSFSFRSSRCSSYSPPASSPTSISGKRNTKWSCWTCSCKIITTDCTRSFVTSPTAYGLPCWTATSPSM